jgi:RNA-splicing ligase RtcB
MSRSRAKGEIDMAEFKKSMKGIYTTSVSKDTIDEAPQAYKPMEEIMEAISDTVDIIDVIRPLYNFKAHE